MQIFLRGLGMPPPPGQMPDGSPCTYADPNCVVLTDPTWGQQALEEAHRVQQALEEAHRVQALEEAHIESQQRLRAMAFKPGYGRSLILGQRNGNGLVLAESHIVPPMLAIGIVAAAVALLFFMRGR